MSFEGTSPTIDLKPQKPDSHTFHPTILRKTTLIITALGCLASRSERTHADLVLFRREKMLCTTEAGAQKPSTTFVLAGAEFFNFSNTIRQWTEHLKSSRCSLKYLCGILKVLVILRRIPQKKINCLEQFLGGGVGGWELSSRLPLEFFALSYENFGSGPRKISFFTLEREKAFSRGSRVITGNVNGNIGLICFSIVLFLILHYNNYIFLMVNFPELCSCFNVTPYGASWMSSPVIRCVFKFIWF